MDGTYMISNSITGRKYIGSSCNVEYRMHAHLSALRGNRHSNKDMQDDFNRYGEKSFSFVPVFERNSGEFRTNKEYFLMDIFRTHDPKYGYNHMDKGGTGTHLNRDTKRSVHEGYLNKFKRAKNYQTFRERMNDLKKVDTSKLTKHEIMFVDACTQSHSFSEAGSKLGVSRQWAYEMIVKILKTSS